MKKRETVEISLEDVSTPTIYSSRLLNELYCDLLTKISKDLYKLSNTPLKFHFHISNVNLLHN